MESGRPDSRYWSQPADAVGRALASGPGGLAGAEALRRLAAWGRNEVRERANLTRLGVLLRQLRSPLLLLLVVAAGVALLTREWIDASIVLLIVAATVGIGYSREYSAQTAAALLRQRLSVRVTALRDGAPVPVPLAEVVPGDVVLLSAGSLVPGDGVILEANNFFLSEAVLTGESFPVEKRPGVSAVAATLAQRNNCVFQGTNVRSGTARVLIVETGTRTAFGAIAGRLAGARPETEFERGTRRFGYLLTVAMLVLVLLVFVAHVLEGRPALETLLFALALAVGLSPELLPAILSVNLARGAREMAGQGVLVRRLEAIENLGSMDVLCTDKTGTLTEGVIELAGAFDAEGVASPAVLAAAATNAALETGLANPLDDAILAAHPVDPATLEKLGEVPFDFVRRRVSVVHLGGGAATLIAKGAVNEMLEACTRTASGTALDAEGIAAIRARVEGWYGQGIRVLAVASRPVARQEGYTRDDECELTLLGFVTFLDRPRPGAGEAVAALRKLGVQLKLITGDHRDVGRHVAGLVGMPVERVLTGEALAELSEEALWHEAPRTQLFAEVDPAQKERIIGALRRSGHVVGFLGDGVNDAPAMFAADTSLSVDSAVDVAREAADFVLLERDLDVIRRGIEEGRRTFANTLKYVQMTTSANLGNMLSMALASLVLPFLPLLPGQVLLNNFLSDIPAVGLASDAVDPEMVDRPRRWEIREIGRFMVQFGLLSALFDAMTFALLLAVYHATPDEFRSGWFVESLLTELVIALVVRTRRPFYRSRPGRVLWMTTAVLVPVACAIPWLPGMEVFGFVPLPAGVIAVVAGVTAAYVLATEVQKRVFYRGGRG